MHPEITITTLNAYTYGRKKGMPPLPLSPKALKGPALIICIAKKALLPLAPRMGVAHHFGLPLEDFIALQTNCLALLCETYYNSYFPKINSILLQSTMLVFCWTCFLPFSKQHEQTNSVFPVNTQQSLFFLTCSALSSFVPRLVFSKWQFQHYQKGLVVGGGVGGAVHKTQIVFSWVNYNCLPKLSVLGSWEQ